MKKQTFPPYVPRYRKEKPIPKVYTAIDNDLARDNLENDLPLADREDIDQAHHL